MKTTSLTLALGLVATLGAGGAQCQQVQFGISDIRGDGQVQFGLGLGHSAAPIIIDRPTPTAEPTRTAFISSRSGDQPSRLLDLIGHAEASGAGYDSVQHGARTKPAKRPTDMTIAEIFDWIKATPGQPHAIGRYQFIPKTLRALVRRGGIGRQDRFSPALQDHLANMLLEDAGYSAFLSGRLSQTRFMYNLAGIWAGLPLPSGRSRYHGYAGNHATISWNTYNSEVTRIFARR